MLILILLVASFVCFVLAALNVPTPPRPNLLASGLALWVLTALIETLHAVAK